MQHWVERFAGLADLEDEWKEITQQQSRVVTVPQDTVLFAPGKSPDNMVFLLEGSVRVQQVSESGREIVLYRIETGQSCIMTTTCLLGQEKYSAEGIAETEVEIAAIPKSLFDALMAGSETFRRFVFGTFSMRLTGLLAMINDVAFRRIDLRLAEKLIALAKGSDTVVATHQDLATELGTAREVVSRQLQEFQRRGWISQSRGELEILNLAALMKMASEIL